MQGNIGDSAEDAPRSSSSFRRLPFLLVGLVVLVGVVVCVYLLWRQRTRLPQPGSPAYEEYVEAFEVGTAKLDSGLIPDAIEQLTLAINLIPQEPAAWANRGLAYLRQARPDLDLATADLFKARELAPGNPTIEELLGNLAERKGQLREAIAHFGNACKADPDNIRCLYQQVELLDREGGDSADAERQQLIEKLLERRPTVLKLLTLRLGLAVQRQDRAAIADTLQRFEKLAPEWSTQTRAFYNEVRKEAQGKYDIADLRLRIFQLDNQFKAEVGYSRSLFELSPPLAQVGVSLQQFIRLAPMRTDPSPADADLAIEAKPFAFGADVVKETWSHVFPVWLNGKDKPVVMVANPREVRAATSEKPRFEFPSGPKRVALTPDSVLAVDWNNDHLTDFVLAGAGGVRFFQQKPDGSFADISTTSKLPASVLQGDHHGAWAVDVDLDGDLDIILAPRSGSPLFLRNNGDDTFLAQPLFSGVDTLRAFAWADLDNDGAADAILLDSKGKLFVFMNERSTQFRRRSVPDEVGSCHALTVADVNDDGVLDVLVLQQGNPLVRLSDRNKGESWDIAELTRLKDKLPGEVGRVRLLAIDLDNNGAVDLVLRTRAGGVAWLADGKGAFTQLSAAIPRGVSDIVGLDDDAPLDLLGWDGQDALARFQTRGTKDYHWHRLRPQADIKGTGDQRVNSFTIGSEVEVRSGSLVVKQPVERPVVHVGLGTRNRLSLIRCGWTSGATQFEFDTPVNAVIVMQQRLKGSCPFLFTWDGKQIVFVADFCWSTPLGLYINAQKRGGGFTETGEWIKIPGDKLVPRDCSFDVRIQANLWETHYLDQLALMVVDHPAETEIFCDERFFLTPTKPRFYLTDPPRPIAKAWDHKGIEVTQFVNKRDGNYLDRAGRGLYQGVTTDHWVEVDPGEELPGQGPVYLLAHGWVRPTDSSINAALEQGSHEKPRPLSLEVSDGKGGWKVALPALGFPAGMNKTMVIRLDGIDGPGVPRRFRLRTNMEIYWDALHIARGLDESACSRTTLAPTRADLQFRGILRSTRADASSPYLPRYNEILTTQQYWRDLIGYHTRFGEVKELVEKVDDRYVMMNSGDEILMRFAVPAPPPLGWKRDYVWISDGWTKDGDMNTRFGKTVLPLPYHGMTDYDRPPGRLEDDPVYRRHASDWQKYHTRHVTPTVFEQGLRGYRRPR
jgi:hypothetical protein